MLPTSCSWSMSLPTATWPWIGPLMLALIWSPRRSPSVLISLLSLSWLITRSKWAAEPYLIGDVVLGSVLGALVLGALVLGALVLGVDVVGAWIPVPLSEMWLSPVDMGMVIEAENGPTSGGANVTATVHC